MSEPCRKVSSTQSGFSLVELLVGMVIGLLATLAIMQVFSVFDGQRRSTTGTADAQTNGSIALLNIQRDIQSAGYGVPLPMAFAADVDKVDSPLLCDPSPEFDPDADASTDNSVKMSPVEIQDGAGDTSDILIVRYSTTAMGAVPVNVINPVGYDNSATGLAAENNLGFVIDEDDPTKNIAVISKDGQCLMTSVEAVHGDQNISLAAIPGAIEGTSPLVPKAKISFMGDWQAYRYEVVNNQLLRNGQPIIDEIVAMHAQFGISATANSSQVTQWVDATAPWDAPTVEQRNRIKAVRLAVVARNGLREKNIVTNTCTTTLGVVNNGPCAWDDEGFNDAPRIDLSTVSDDWQFYRYRSFETIMPLRNMIWSKDAL